MNNLVRLFRLGVVAHLVSFLLVVVHQFVRFQFACLLADFIGVLLLYIVKVLLFFSCYFFQVRYESLQTYIRVLQLICLIFLLLKLILEPLFINFYRPFELSDADRMINVLFLFFFQLSL